MMRRWRASLALWMMLVAVTGLVALLDGSTSAPRSSHSARASARPASIGLDAPSTTTLDAAPVTSPSTTSTTSPPTTSPSSTATTTTTSGASSLRGASDATTTTTTDWDCIRVHESGDNYSEHGGGAYQFEAGTWEAVTGLSGTAQTYPPATQDAAALKLHAERGFEPWTTRTLCGL